MIASKEKISKWHVFGTALNFLSFSGIIALLAFAMQLGQYKQKVDSAVQSLKDLTTAQSVYSNENTREHENMHRDISLIKIQMSAITGKVIN